LVFRACNLQGNVEYSGESRIYRRFANLPSMVSDVFWLLAI
jgi:hypothetical protein